MFRSYAWVSQCMKWYDGSAYFLRHSRCRCVASHAWLLAVSIHVCFQESKRNRGGDSVDRVGGYERVASSSLRRNYHGYSGMKCFVSYCQCFGCCCCFVGVADKPKLEGKRWLRMHGSFHARQQWPITPGFYLVGNIIQSRRVKPPPWSAKHMTLRSSFKVPKAHPTAEMRKQSELESIL